MTCINPCILSKNLYFEDIQWTLLVFACIFSHIYLSCMSFLISIVVWEWYLFKMCNALCIHWPCLFPWSPEVLNRGYLTWSLTECVFISGITNHDEYSLVQDLTDEEREKTLTLKRGQSIAKDQKKLDEMKRKLHTDDECESCFPFHAL